MTKQDAINVLADTPYLRKPNGDADTEYVNAIDIAIECIEQWSRVCEWIDSDSMKDIAEYVHRYGIEYITKCIEKQIPKKPMHFEHPIAVEDDVHTVWEYDCCPTCGEEVREDYDDFCSKCGKAIYWSDNE